MRLLTSALLILLGIACAHFAVAQPPLLINESQLSEMLPSAWPHDGVVVAPDGTQLYFKSLIGREMLYQLESFEWRNANYVAVWTITPSSPSQRSTRAIRQAYVARSDRKQWRVIVDKKAGKSFTEIQDASLILSPNSERIAYVARDKEGWHAVIDGIVSPPASRINTPTFSPDSRHIAYIAENKGKSRIIRDGIRGQAYDYIDGDRLLFSADSNHLAYAVQMGKQYMMVLDGKTGPQYSWLGSPVFSPDGKHLAYSASQGKLERIVRDGQVGPWYEQAYSPMFSADNRHFAYEVHEKHKAFFVIDGSTGKRYDGVYDFHFSPDGKRFAYIAREGTRCFAVIDSREGPAYTNCFTDGGGLLFSPNSQRVAYIAAKGNSWRMVVDGIEDQPSYQYVCFPTFSPDSRRFAYVAMNEGKTFCIIDGQPGATADAISIPAFSPDSQRSVYAVRIGKEWHLHIDDHDQNPLYDLIFTGSTDSGKGWGFGVRKTRTYRKDLTLNNKTCIFEITAPSTLWDAPERLIFMPGDHQQMVRFIALKNNALYWVEETLEENRPEPARR